MRWGLVPCWGKASTAGFATINATTEGVWGFLPICAYLGLSPSLPTPPLRHLLLSVRTCTGSLLPPSTRGRFLMDPTPWTATQKPMQVVQARLETGLRPSALHLLP